MNLDLNKKIFIRFRKDKDGLEILENKPRIRENISIDKLMDLPKNTFGFLKKIIQAFISF